jgi:hypothetical protein
LKNNIEKTKQGGCSGAPRSCTIHLQKVFPFPEELRFRILFFGRNSVNFFLIDYYTLHLTFSLSTILGIFKQDEILPKVVKIS